MAMLYRPNATREAALEYICIAMGNTSKQGALDTLIDSVVANTPEIRDALIAQFRNALENAAEKAGEVHV